jgi:flagellar hook protein FlgE
MSINSAMLAGASGMRSNSSALASISDNIANVNTVGYYSRAGQFTPDSDGYLKNTANYFLQGWPVDSTGAVTANPTDLNALEPIRVSGIAGGAEMSSQLSLSANLQSSQAVSPAAATYDADTSANNMASGAVTPDFQIPIQVYDSQGGLHTLTFSFLKQGPNAWYAEIHLPASEIVPTATLVDGQLAAGIVRFTPFGQLDVATSTLPTTVTINQNGVAGAPQWAAALGLATQTMDLDMGGPGTPGGLTNYDSPSVLGTSQVDGTPFGSLASVDVDDDGFVTAIFTNGLTRRIYQIPLATFGNVDGLVPEHGGVYRLGPGAGGRCAAPASAAQATSSPARWSPRPSTWRRSSPT